MAATLMIVYFLLVTVAGVENSFLGFTASLYWKFSLYWIVTIIASLAIQYNNPYTMGVRINNRLRCVLVRRSN